MLVAVGDSAGAPQGAAPGDDWELPDELIDYQKGAVTPTGDIEDAEYHGPDAARAGLNGPVSDQSGEVARAGLEDRGGSEQDVEPARRLPEPGQPTKAMIEEHRDDQHIPYRSWCSECVEGRATGEQHNSRKDERLFPVLVFDYMLITRDFQIIKNVDGVAEKKIALKLIVAKDTRSKAVFAHGVKHKGPGDDRYAVSCMAEDIKWLGYHRIGLKCDNERAIVKLLTEVLKAAKVQVEDTDGEDQATFEEHPTPYDHKSNGFIENAVRNLQGLMRTLKLELERSVGAVVPSEHPLLHWLAEHTAWQITTRIRGEDGLTPFARIRGKIYAKRLARFCERVLYKLPMEGPQAPKDKLQRRWKQWYILGYSRTSNDYRLITEEGLRVVMARSVQRVMPSERWRPAVLEGITVTPQGLAEPHQPGVVFGPRVPTKEPELPRRRAPQRIALRQADFDHTRGGHGFTEGCPKCDHAVMHGWGKTSQHHSPACVARLAAELQKTVDGRRRLACAEERAARHQQEKLQAEGELPTEGEHRAEGEEMLSDAADAPPPRFLLPREDASGDRDRALHPDGDADPRDEADDVFARDDVDGEDDGHNNPEAERAGLPEAAPDGNAMDVDLVEDAEGVSAEARSSWDEVCKMCRTDEAATKELHDHDKQILALVQSLGGQRERYKRERARALRGIVSEVYSPPRVTAAAKLMPSMQMLPGLTLDLTTKDENGVPWDFSKEDRRRAARTRLEKEKPFILIGSPECKKYCTWQALRDQDLVRRDRIAAGVHMQFVCELYQMQIDANRYFLHEHPDGATSWDLRCIRKILAQPSVEKVAGDQCQYGQSTEDGEPMRKRTGWMSNSSRVLRRLSLRCLGRGGQCTRREGGKHAVVSGRARGRQAAIYPFRLCRAILEGARDQLRDDGQINDGIFCILPRPDTHLTDAQLQRRVCRGFHIEIEEEVLVVEGDSEGAAGRLDSGGKPAFRDNLTGQPLIPELVRAARREELEYFTSRREWELRPFEEARRRQGKPPISVRWVDVNKGDDLNPQYRSRLVAREIRRSGEDPIFAPTPPLESIRTIFSVAATDFPGAPQHDRSPTSERRTQVQLLDISRAYLSAHTDPNDPTYVALPKEHEGSRRGCCGLLLRHMYGTRKAADGWHCEYSETLVQLGFEVGIASPCVFLHTARGLRCAVYGDDLTTTGPKCELDWFKAALEKHYELKELARLGPGPEDHKEARILNRVVRWTSNGLEYEADPRQCERLVRDLKLDGSKPVTTPGVKPTLQQTLEDSELDHSKRSPFRAVAARGNYLAADRPDVQFAAKEICRWMSRPTEQALQGLKRLGRYLEGQPRVVYEYRWQTAEGLEVYSDTDWAGCARTRKSTSGGCLMVGTHLIKSWSSTQNLIALSSGEAEFYGVVKAAGTGLGYQALLTELGIHLPLRVWTDSTASIGICGRQGLGKLRHIDTQALWIQQRVRDGNFELRKVKGTENPADLFTKYLVGADRVRELLRLFSCRYQDGRAETAPRLRETGGTTKGELLTVQDGGSSTSQPIGNHLSDIPEELTVSWDGRTFPRAPTGEDESGMLPDAFPCQRGALPHQHKDHSERFPRALCRPAQEDQDPHQDESLCAHGSELGCRRR